MSTPLVLDASAAVRLVVGPVPPAIAQAVEGASLVVAPSLFGVETANALWKYVRAGCFDIAAAVTRLNAALGLCDRIVCETDTSAYASLLAEAMTEASRCDHPVYDLIYLVTARRLTAHLATCDNRLAALTVSYGMTAITP